MPLLAEVVFSTEGIVIISALLAALAGAVAFLFRNLMTSKDANSVLALKIMDDRLRESEGLKKIFSEVAAEAVRSATETQNYYRQKEGKPPLILPTPVIAEGSSPSSPTQLEQAQAASMRAALVAIKEAAGQEPRKAPGEPKDLQGGDPAKADRAMENAGRSVIVAAEAVSELKQVATSSGATPDETRAAAKKAGEAAIVASDAVKTAKSEREKNGPGRT